MIFSTVFFFSNEIVQIVLRSEMCDLQWQTRELDSNSTSFCSHFLAKQAGELSRDINGNISSKPPFRLVLHYQQHGDSRTYLTLSIHHSIYDGITLPLLLKDVESFYLDERDSTSLPLDKVLDTIYSVDYEEAKTFWTGLFKNFDWSKIPNRLASGQSANTHSIDFSEATLRECEERASNAKVSLQAVLTAAFGITLGSQLYGCQDVVFGVRIPPFLVDVHVLI